jgi:hypothetical protein
MLKVYPEKKKLKQSPEQKMEQERVKYLELISKFLEAQLSFEIEDKTPFNKKLWNKTN